MHDRTDHLDLLADHILTKMDSSCGGAVREAFADAVLEACKIEPNFVSAEGEARFEWAKHEYAKGLLRDVLAHMAGRWSQYRATDKRLCSASRPVYEDESDFEP